MVDSMTLEGSYYNYLHYSLDFLEPSKTWPPQGDAVRMLKYRWEQEQFELVPEEFAQRILPRGLMDLTDDWAFVHWNKILSYPRLNTLKINDMVIGQPPVIQAEDKDILTASIRDLRIASGFDIALQQALIDYSRFGAGLIRLFKDENNEWKAIAWNVREWVPVFYDDGTNRIKYNVLGWKESENTLVVQIHHTKDGHYEQRKYRTDGFGTILELVESNVFNTDTNQRLLYTLINTPTTTNPLGTSDYEAINGPLQKAIERLTAILRVLDEHADPSLTGPSSLLEMGDDGKLVFKTNKYYARSNKDEPEPKYLVWDANLESSFKAFNILIEHIYILSELGPAIMGAKEGTGNVVSGTAMRFKMISPLEKARRIQNSLTDSVCAIMSALVNLSNHSLEVNPKDILVFWKDSLPRDPKEVADLIKSESGSTACKPLINSIMDNYDLDRETAQKYCDEIEKDLQRFKKSSDPIIKEGDGRSHPVNGVPDSRKKDSIMDPASSENRGDDQN